MFINFKKIANPRIEGTHNPINIAASFSPLNQSNSEKIKEENAAISISKSEVVSFFSMFDFVIVHKCKL
ncbi:MAG: hypothetical protein ACKO52_04710 [Sediminibacterium sp.]